MERDQLQEDMIQSEKEFREQFDLNSEKHHKGSTQAVPLGGARIPTSMPQEYPENFNPNETGPTREELGEEYIRLEKQREVLTGMKKILAKQAQLTEAVFRHNEHFREKGDKTNPQHVQKHKANIDKEEKELAIVNKQLSDIATTLATLGNEYKETERDIELIIKDSLSHFKTKEELTDFGFRSKKISAKSFADAAKLLDAMKKIKKNYKKPEQEVGKEVPKAQ